MIYTINTIRSLSRLHVASVQLGADVEGGTDVRASTVDGKEIRPPLVRAGWNGHVSTMEVLLAHGANGKKGWCCEQITNDGRALLRRWLNEDGTTGGTEVEHRAVLLQRRVDDLTQKYLQLDALLSVNEKNKMYKQRMQETWLSAAAHGDPIALEQVLLQGVQGMQDRAMEDVLTLNTCTDSCGRTLLSMCAWKGHSEAVQVLLTLWKRFVPGRPEEDLAQKDGAATTRADESLRALSLRVLQVDSNARFTWNGCFGWTSYGVACFCGHLKVIETLRKCSWVHPWLGTEFAADCFDLSKIMHLWGGDPNNKHRLAMTKQGRKEEEISTNMGLILALQGMVQEYVHPDVVGGGGGEGAPFGSLYLQDRPLITVERVQASIDQGQSVALSLVAATPGGEEAAASSTRMKIDNARQLDVVLSGRGQVLNPDMQEGVLMVGGTPLV